MRSFVLALILVLSLGASAAAQGNPITSPIDKARAAAAAASARTEAQQRDALGTRRPDSAAATTAAKPGTTATTTNRQAAGSKAGPTVPPAVAAAKGAAGTPAPDARGSATPPANVASGKAAATAPAADRPAPPAPGAATPAGASKAPVSATADAPKPAAATADGKGVTGSGSKPSNTVEPASDSSRTVTASTLNVPRPDIAISREVFQYDPAGRRDPFVSLLATDDLRPLLTDLLLTSTIVDRNPRNSVAIMRDVKTKEQYRARTGQLVGRMRVTTIQAKQIVFTIEEFGFSRQEILIVGDTSKVRK